MSKENLEVVRKLFESVERRDLAGVLAAYDGNIVIREAASLPYGGEYRGIKGAQKHSYGYVQAWENFQADGEQKMDAEFFEAGDYVIVKWRQRAKSEDQKLDLPATSIYRLRDGKIIESEMFQDTAKILRFLGDRQNAD